jgi:hypothetical protein
MKSATCGQYAVIVSSGGAAFHTAAATGLERGLALFR